jgi:hypothetical protein
MKTTRTILNELNLIYSEKLSKEKKYEIVEYIKKYALEYHENELNKLRVNDVSSSFCEKCNPNGIVDGNIIKCKTCGRGLALIEQNAY